MALVALTPGVAGATTICHRVAATNGSDSNPGTAGQPFRTPGKLAETLTEGQTGCLRGGTYSFTSETVRLARADVTLTSYPGERAKLVGRLWVAQGADGVTVSDLDLDGRNADDLPSPTVTAHDTVWRGLDVTNGHDRTICFQLGSGSYGNANRTVIEDSRIHDCGELPADNHHHGIYVLHANGSVIRDNVIYSNADRGVNLYPAAKRVRILGNVIDGNGEGVMFAGAGGHASSRNVVAGNIISNSTVRYNVESWWAGKIGRRNVARRNCLFASNGRSAHYNKKGGVANRVGFRTARNRVRDPRYVDRSAGDFRLEAGSGCEGYGPEAGGSKALIGTTFPSAGGGVEPAVNAGTSRRNPPGRMETWPDGDHEAVRRGRRRGACARLPPGFRQGRRAGDV